MERPTKAVKEPDGKLLCTKTLALIGYWFEVDGVTYYGMLEDWNKV